MDNTNIERQVLVSGILVAVISAILIGISAFTYASIQKAQRQEAKQYLDEIVTQYKNIITAQLDGNFQTLEALSAFIGQTDSFDLDKALSYLEVESSRSGFFSIGFVTPEKNGYFIYARGSKRYGQDVSSEVFLDRALGGECTVSEKMTDEYTGNDIICYGVPVYHDDQIVGVLTASMLTSAFSNIIEQEIFDGEAFAHIIDRNGDFIIRSSHVVIQEQLDNMFDMGDIQETTKHEVLSNLMNGESSFTVFDYNGSHYWVTIMPVGINDWQLFCLVPQDFLNHNFDTLITVFLGVLICIILMFSILFIYINRLIRRSQESMRQLAYTDLLTGAGNRNQFITEVPGLPAGTQKYAMVLLNISGFKFINEFYGYETGDELLKHIAAVLADETEREEPYYRDSADRFGMLLKFHGKDALTERLERIREQVNNFKLSQNQSYHIITNWGVKIIEDFYSEIKTDLDTVMNCAMLALNSVKGNDKKPIAFYDETLHQQASKKSEIESRMYDALENREFVMVLQPKYDLKTMKVNSAESLVRWYAKDGTVYYPDEFISVFEQNGFISNLDMYMLEEVCRCLSRWKEAGYEAVPVSVNQSRLFFYDDEYLDRFHKIVDHYHLEPSQIILEVTESVSMNNLDQIKNVISQLHKVGFTVSMDDFGSGYSSLNTLKELDIDEVKLDKEFLSEQADSTRGEAIIRNMIQLAEDLSIVTVAEGIETRRQMEFLKSISCDIGQGYYFARPMPVDKFEELVFGKQQQI
ncbi:EAL domain-containing protein [Ruminococcus sp. OA3]|uniref:bifunctional diguanylate cyclase/phosphodiesterase n=1 Tax=Ruminococcus sp. OA3 TaxID=2914164 RepID=UPI001F0536E5|nr:EAL domain-containing protein [Ruminococcus sp. OA3]MCH1984350.1 EAL domain-containing protein [Ruminococcus sp. OA3]